MDARPFSLVWDILDRLQERPQRPPASILCAPVNKNYTFQIWQIPAHGSKATCLIRNSSTLAVEAPQAVLCHTTDRLLHSSAGRTYLAAYNTLEFHFLHFPTEPRVRFEFTAQLLRAGMMMIVQ